MTSLEGVYWDLDGTIANTELEAHLPAFNYAFKELGINWYWDTNKYIDLLKINGGKNRIFHYSKSVNDYLSEDLVIKIHEKKQFHYLETIKKNCVSCKTGVFRLVNEFSTAFKGYLKSGDKFLIDCCKQHISSNYGNQSKEMKTFRIAVSGK